MKLTEVVSTLWRKANWPSRAKIHIDKYADPAMFLATANGAYLWGWDKSIDYAHFWSDEAGYNRGAIVLGTHAALGLGMYALNRFKFSPFRHVAKKLNNFHQERILYGQTTPFRNSGIRSLTQMAGIGALAWAAHFPATIQNLYWDAERVGTAVITAMDRGSNRGEELAEIAENVELEAEKKEIAQIPKSEVATPQINVNTILGYSKKSTHGRFLRALRWDTHFSNTEKKYGIPNGLLAGLAMRESYGDPLQLNSSGDGGAGLMQFQPGTARAYGLSVYGNSNRMGRDRHHGRKLSELIKNCNYNYVCAGEKDQRFNVVKSIDASARLLKDNHVKHGTWDAALSAYNRGTPAKTPAATSHVKGTKQLQAYYNEHKIKYLN